MLALCRSWLYFTVEWLRGVNTTLRYTMPGMRCRHRHYECDAGITSSGTCKLATDRQTDRLRERQADSHYHQAHLHKTPLVCCTRRSTKWRRSTAELRSHQTAVYRTWPTPGSSWVASAHCDRLDAGTRRPWPSSAPATHTHTRTHHATCRLTRVSVTDHSLMLNHVIQTSYPVSLHQHES